MDQRVQEVQTWLNNRYPNYFKYDPEGVQSGTYPIQPDGITGNTTVKALIMALQINLSLSPIDGIWGNGTTNACPIISASTTNVDLIKIVQGGYICKGYNPGPLDGIFGVSCENATQNFKNDLGLAETAAVLAPLCFKFLLTTDPSKETLNTDKQIRKFQQFLNRKYSSVFLNKLGYISTGGYYDRLTARAIIFAFQSAIGTTADGALGPATFSKMPSISSGNTADKFVELLRGMLVCNGYSSLITFEGSYDTSLAMLIETYQKFMKLDNDPLVELGKVNRRTWGALLWSKGDIDRNPNACDCRTKILDTSLATALFNGGFQFIGRYLTNVEPNGFDKKLTPEEITILLNAGMKIFPIFQESPRSPVLPTDFTLGRGVIDAKKAISAALNLGLPKNTIIYFALDCDMLENEISNYAIPYFSGINSIFMEYANYYRIGVYGARNSCQKVCMAGYAINTFVANMSTGYSGNLGYIMPQNWSFEQFLEKKNNSIAGYTFDLDFDMASGNDSGVASIDLGFDVNGYTPPYIPSTNEIAQMKPISDLIPAIHWLEETYYFTHGVQTPDVIQANSCFMAVLDFLYQYQYNEYKWDFISPKDDAFINLINTSYSDNEYVKLLHPYIFATTTGADNEKITTRAKLVTDGSLGAFELPHLAVVIKCYIQSLAPGSWSAWSGDFATSIKEIYIGKGNDTASYISYGSERIGDMEKDTITDIESRQFNYCDLIADIDGYKIEKMMKNSLSIYSLSECLESYYGDRNKYYKRYQYFKDILNINDWNIMTIKGAILFHFNLIPILKYFFAPETDNYPGSVDAAAIVLAMNIIYWAKFTSVF